MSPSRNPRKYPVRVCFEKGPDEMLHDCGTYMSGYRRLVQTSYLYYYTSAFIVLSHNDHGFV